MTSKSNEIHGLQGMQTNTAWCVPIWKQMEKRMIEMVKYHINIYVGRKKTLDS